MIGLFFLFLIQLIWASSYVAQKMAVTAMPLGLVLILRYGIATLLFLLAGQLNFKEKFSRKEWLLIFFVGVLNFTGSPFFQLTALTKTVAIDTAILITFEPLVTTLLAILFLKERINRWTWLAFFAATVGVMIMSLHRSALGVFQWTRLWGDLIFLCSLLCEATCSTASRHLTQKYSPLKLIAWMTCAGFLANLLANFPLLTSQNLKAIPVAGWLDLFYLALFCSCIGYGVWVSLLKRISVSQLSLSLFLQPILGTFFAVLILNEKLDFKTVLGGMVVLTSLLVWLLFRGFQKQNGDIDMVADLGGGGAVNEISQKTMPVR